MKPRKLLHLFLITGAILYCRCVDANEPFLKKLPPGLFLKNSTEVPKAATRGISQKLGGEIARLTNSTLQVHGRAIQINGITASDEANAKAIHANLVKLKAYPFCLRTGSLVIEYVGKDLDEAIAIKTSYELGLVPKPASVQYRIVAELVPIDKAHYMSCNLLFNKLREVQDSPDVVGREQIAQLSQRFQFGRTLKLTNPKHGNQVVYRFEPAATAVKETGATTSHSFGDLPDRLGVPYVVATLELTVDATGLRKTDAVPSKELTAATAFWPADELSIKALAQRTTQGLNTNSEKARAILEWLTPGKNLKYSGQTGSRWGTSKVFEQKFGHCWDFSDCFVTLMRAAGVPARQVAGWLYGSSGHVWAEYYREGQGWQQVDPTGGGMLTCGIYHINYFTSEDGDMPIVYASMPKIEVVGNP